MAFGGGDSPIIGFHHLLLNQNERPHSPPLGVLTLMQLVRNSGREAYFNQFVHLKGTILSPEHLAQQIVAQPGVAAISTMINGLPLLVMALRLVKSRDPEKKIIVGGPGFTGIAKEAIENYPGMDIVCFGEGEMQILELMEYLDGNCSLEDVPGVCFRQNGEIIKTDQAGRIKDLDSLPYLCFDAINLRSYNGFPIMASRGCPFKCSFCDVAPSWGRRNTRRSVEHVLDELDYLYHEKGIRKISFVDDLFIVNRKWVIDFCEQKLKRGNKMIWRGNGHINLANEELIELMAEAGCESMFYGVESGSDRVLQKIVKDFTLEKAKKVLRFTDKYMNTHINLIWGYPFETTDDLILTLEAHSFFKERGIGVSLVMLAPLQSAPMTEQYKDLVLNFNYQNIFLQDYYELDAKYGSEFEQLLKSDSKVFSAFYAFASPQLEEHKAIVDHYQDEFFRSGQFATPRELWQGV